MQSHGTKVLRGLAIGMVILIASAIASSQDTAVGNWTKLKNQPTFKTDIGLLLTDGSVMVHQYMSPNWYRLIPTNTGNYINGTWKQTAPMQSSYAPLYFASAVLPDGRVLVEGGEYNNFQGNETNMGSIYDPVADKWTVVNPPTNWRTIGDSPAVILPDGTFMMGQGGQPAKLQVNFNASNLTWTSVGTGKADGFSEEGFALTPEGKVLTVDCEDGTNSELYDPSSQAWSTAGSTINVLPNSGGLGIVPEMGPLVQRPDGTIVAFGATTHNSIFDTTSGTWSKGPDYPGGNDIADGMGTLLPDGNILVFTSPGVFAGTGTFFEFTTSNTFVQAPNTVSGQTLQSWQGRLLGLPTGQVLYTAADGASSDTEVYTPIGGPKAAWRPVITGGPQTVTHGQTFTLSGKQFNGLSAGSTYGDDGQNATNYPIVVIRNKATGHFSFTRTHNFSSGIATGNTTVSTDFDVPAGIETGASTIYVVANGIASGGKAITVN